MINRTLITAVLLLAVLSLSAGKIPVKIAQDKDYKVLEPHPLQKYFEKPLTPAERATRNRAVDNRLLVMLIDFQKDNDPATTGNGKFVYDPGDYPLDIGKPPHDQEYFWWILESVRYYYQAASLGSYDLDFDIYPQHQYTESDTAVVAYTLPNEMSYYNPPGASTELMISRFEEYFQDVFTVVDADTTVDFSEYGHYMIMHAGTDSQHDINGDSQADIPSFFIKVGDGKEVYVDEGIMINYACNVPETISQDDQYGVTNAVVAHEFGHSLGFVDLYSTLTGAPQVGWYDIMDSGGMGELVTESNGEVFNIEGGLPTMPSVWHRVLVWEDYFREHGLLKDIDELNWGDDIRIDPATKLFYGGDAPYPRFIKVPLTEDEYLLLENRQVDPDGDGGMSFKGALAQTPDDPDNKRYRILLYPTYPYYISSDQPNWEYDLFLPGWQREETDRILNYGGGLMVWHIDDRIIYEDGEYQGDEFLSNYDMNTVNALHTRRGVEILEADGFDNIGNYDDSYNIMGSAWDPFYRYQPILDGNDEFQRWADQGIPGNIELDNDDEFVHTVEFNGNSQPALVTNDDDPAMFGLYDISSYSIITDQERFMTFKYGTHVFDKIEVLDQYDNLNNISPVGMMYGLPTIAVFADDKIDLFHQVGTDWDDYLQFSYTYEHELSEPVQVHDIDGDGNDEFILISDNLLSIIDEDQLIDVEEFNSEFSDAPMYTENGDVIYPIMQSLIINSDEFDFPEAEIAFADDMILARNKQKIAYIDVETANVIEQYGISAEEIVHDPVIFKDQETMELSGYTITEDCVVYKISGQQMLEIFDCHDYTNEVPSQLMLTPLEENGATRIVFASGDKLFALTLEGTLVKGFPVLLEDKPVSGGSYIKSLLLNDEVIFMLERESGGVLAIDASGVFRQEYSAVIPQGSVSSKYWFDDINSSLSWFSSSENTSFYHAELSDHESDPLLNPGWRAGNNGLFTGRSSDLEQEELSFSAYAFPNPARDGYFRVRIEGAEAEIGLKLYDIAGNLVREKTADLENSPYQDIRIDTSGLASGVYYARLKSSSKMLTTPVGIVK